MDQQGTKSRLSLVEVLIVLYCAWSSRALIEAWIEAPLEKYSWLLFLIWTTPLVIQGFYPLMREPRTLAFMGVGALVLAIIGNMGSLNALCYLGLAVACGALLPLKFQSALWLLSSTAWMPAIGWISAHYVPFPVFPLRLLIVLLGVGMWIFWRWGLYTSEDRL